MFANGTYWPMMEEARVEEADADTTYDRFDGMPSRMASKKWAIRGYRCCDSRSCRTADTKARKNRTTK